MTGFFPSKGENVERPQAVPQARGDIYAQLVSLAEILEDNGESQAAANVRLAITRLSFLKDGEQR